MSVTPPSKCNTIAIVVLFHPEHAQLTSLVKSLERQVAKIILIWNSDNKAVNSISGSNIINIMLSENKGIAEAQNIATQHASNMQAKFVVYSDQDSVFPENYIETLSAVFQKISDKNSIGLIAPAYRDENKGNKVQPAVKFGRFGLKKTYQIPSIYRASHVISSGSLVSLAAYELIGPFRTDFFMDWIDTEWCWRAGMKGFNIIQTGDCILQHAIGSTDKPHWLRGLTVHSNNRDYYKLRNAIHMVVHGRDLTKRVRLYLIKITLKNIVLYLLKNVNKLDATTILILHSAIIDGFKGRLGKIERA